MRVMKSEMAVKEITRVRFRNGSLTIQQVSGIVKEDETVV